jgi:pSer/pThr/pTyr-binding forkhead associated (FHA) protein
MPILTLKFKDNPIKTYSFGKDKSISIGRRENNDIVISNLTVSGNHAKIDFTGDSYLLTDLKSKNKTYINDEEVTSYYLNDGDVIAIGKHTLEFRLGEGEDIAAEMDNGMDQTMAMNTEAHRDLLKKTMVTKESEDRKVAMLGFVEGGDGKIELSRKLTKIGKDPSNDIIVHGFMVGKTAALISQTPQGYAISHYGGLTRVKVNNQSIRNSVLLEEFDVIKIGSVELQFFYK